MNPFWGTKLKRKEFIFGNKIDNIIEEIELDLIEFVNSDLEERKKLLPLTGRRNIKSLIWNLFNSEKFKNELSFNDYNRILDIWFDRL